MLKSFLLITAVSSMTVASQIFLKKGLMAIREMGGVSLQNIHLTLLKLLQNKFALLGLVFAVIAALVWLMVISKVELTAAFPISGAIFYLLLFVFSWLFLGEAVTVWKISGVIAILSGVFLISK